MYEYHVNIKVATNTDVIVNLYKVCHHNVIFIKTLGLFTNERIMFQKPFRNVIQTLS